MQQSQPFQPAGATESGTPNAQAFVALTTAVQQVTLPAVASDNNTMLVIVEGPSNAAWCYGSNANLTLSNGAFQLGNQVGGTTMLYDLPAGTTQLSVIGSAAIGVFRVVVGTGGT